MSLILETFKAWLAVALAAFPVVALSIYLYNGDEPQPKRTYESFLLAVIASLLWPVLLYNLASIYLEVRKIK